MRTLVIVIVWTLVLWLVIGSIRRMVHRRKLKGMGDRQYAVVRYVSGTGSSVNNVPTLLVTLELTDAQGLSYRTDITRTFDPGGVPRLGDRMAVWVNPNDPSDFDIADATPLPPGYIP